MITPPKYPRTYHHPCSPGLQNDDRVHTNPNLLIGKEIIVTEKIDGGNTAILNGEIFARSTGQVATQGWFRFVKKHHAWKTIGKDYILYGEEFAAKHSIEYTVEEENTYNIFAVVRNNKFLSWDEIILISNSLQINTVPVLFRGIMKTDLDLQNFFNFEIKNPSKYGSEREGFVVRIADEFNFNDFDKFALKYVRKNHVQTDEHWTKNWTWNNLKG